MVTVPDTFRKAVLSWAPKLMADFSFSKEDAAAVLGNAGHESNGFRTMQEIKPVAGRGGLGAFQWTGPRRIALEAWLRRKNAIVQDLEASYGFLFRELKGPEKRAVGLTRAAKTLTDKVVAFELAFERAGVKHYPSRIEWANKALALLNELDAPAHPAVCPTCGQPWPKEAQS